MSRWSDLLNRRALATVAVCVTLALLTGASDNAAPPQRARPPQWSADVEDVFFDDARSVLQGQRPDYAALRATGRGITHTAVSRESSDENQKDKLPWSALVDAETLETEIKRLAQQVSREVTAPAPFKGGGYQRCADHFSVLAALFAVVAQYDGEVRWQDSAAGLRELFAEAALSCEGTDESYGQAARRSQDLADLVRGSRPQTLEAAPTAEWGLVADRPPLMRRIEQAQQSGLSPWLASPGEFRRHRDDVLHEAQLLAMLSNVIAQEGFDAWDDPPYAEYAGNLRSAAQAITTAAEQNEFETAREALGRAIKACSDCHDHYRG